MCFPDTFRANAETRRVLGLGGRYVLATFNRLDLNPVPKAAGNAVATLFPEDPRYMERDERSDVGTYRDRHPLSRAASWASARE